jgi:hypothetical protein
VEVISVKSKREEGNSKREIPSRSVPATQTSTGQADVMRKGGEKKKIKGDRLSHSATAGQRK